MCPPLFQGRRLSVEETVMKTIGIACCFFGKWPRWGDLFVESCRHNPTIDFYLITDCAPPRQTSSVNTRFVSLDLAGFNALASERLGIEVNIKRPLKIAEFKPTYGVLFKEYLEGYEFWGWCDLDVVFGDIRTFLTDELLDQYDVIATRKEFITGHFTLFRNIDRITRFYESSRDYVKVFGGEKYHFFDECGLGLHFRLLRGEAFADIASEAPVDSLMHVLERSPDIRVHRKMLCDEHLPFKGFASIVKEVRWGKGKVVDVPTQRELMYYHFNFLKNAPGFYVPAWEKMPEAFRITLRGVHWVGEEDLTRRLAAAVCRRLYLIRRLPSLYYRYFRWYLLRLLAGSEEPTG